MSALLRRKLKLAESARLVLPYLAAALSRCLRERRDPDHLIRAIAMAGRYLEVENGRRNGGGNGHR